MTGSGHPSGMKNSIAEYPEQVVYLIKTTGIVQSGAGEK